MLDSYSSIVTAAELKKFNFDIPAAIEITIIKVK